MKRGEHAWNAHNNRARAHPGVGESGKDKICEGGKERKRGRKTGGEGDVVITENTKESVHWKGSRIVDGQSARLDGLTATARYVRYGRPLSRKTTDQVGSARNKQEMTRGGCFRPALVRFVSRMASVIPRNLVRLSSTL